MQGRFDILKPAGITSQKVVHTLRKKLGIKKAGHSGTLDPMATGVLNVYVEKATKFIDLLKSDDKEYIATMRFGYRSNTLDIWGELEAVDHDKVQLHALEAVLPEFMGKTLQVPPMVSALKRDGIPLYRYAREGIVLEREARAIEIFALEVLDFKFPEAVLRVHCSKGTYIRSLIDDIGNKLGVPAVMRQLQRRKNDYVDVSQCVALDQLSEADLRCVASFQPWPQLEIDIETLRDFRNGKRGTCLDYQGDVKRLLLFHGGEFVGTAKREGHLYIREKMV